MFQKPKFSFLYLEKASYGFPGGSDGKESPAVQETWIWSLGWEDLLEKEVTTHSSIFAWRIPWTEEPVGYSPSGCKESHMTEQLTHPHHHNNQDS